MVLKESTSTFTTETQLKILMGRTTISSMSTPRQEIKVSSINVWVDMTIINALPNATLQPGQHLPFGENGLPGVSAPSLAVMGQERE